MTKAKESLFRLLFHNYLKQKFPKIFTQADAFHLSSKINFLFQVGRTTDEDLGGEFRYHKRMIYMEVI